MAENTYNHNNILGISPYHKHNGKENNRKNESASQGRTLSDSKRKPSVDPNGKSSSENTSDSMNKTAIALSYNPMDNAPRIIASGKGHLADKIIKAAGEQSIPIHKDEQLAGTLSKLEIGDAIPPELYEIVADILVFVDHMDRIKSKVLPKKE
jgi:flagellar biosynthesis protein